MFIYFFIHLKYYVTSDHDDQQIKKEHINTHTIEGHKCKTANQNLPLKHKVGSIYTSLPQTVSMKVCSHEPVTFKQGCILLHATATPATDYDLNL